MHFFVCNVLASFHTRALPLLKRLTRRKLRPLRPVLIHINLERSIYNFELHFAFRSWCLTKVDQLGKHFQLSSRCDGGDRATQAGVPTPAVVDIGLFGAVEVDLFGFGEFLRVGACGDKVDKDKVAFLDRDCAVPVVDCGRVSRDDSKETESWCCKAETKEGCQLQATSGSKGELWVASSRNIPFQCIFPELLECLGRVRSRKLLDCRPV